MELIGIVTAKLFPSPCGVNIVGNFASEAIQRSMTLRVFPSPCGVNIVGNKSSTPSKETGGISEFPSPCGVNIVGNSSPEKAEDCSAYYVSVPLRGKYCRE